MEETDLTSEAYWRGEGIDIRLNPHNPLDLTGVEEIIRDRGVSSAIVLATSGTTGEAKLVVLEKRAFLVSAGAVNRWCRVTRDDTWLGGLSNFHVGGLGIYARACLSGSSVRSMDWRSWTRDGRAFVEACAGVTLTSLTPVHLHDLVAAEVCCPPSLRGVFLGGGAAPADLVERARNLGWPLWTTFGMTEACSQIATDLEGGTRWLPILPHWDCRTDEEGRLAIRGEALMRATLRRDRDVFWDWREAAAEDGFYATGDRVELDSGRLLPRGRMDDQVKVLGERVSLGALEQSLRESLGRPAIVWARSDARRGHVLFASVEGAEGEGLDEAFARWNGARAPFERVESMGVIARFPRTGSGKWDRAEIRRRMEDG